MSKNQINGLTRLDDDLVLRADEISHLFTYTHTPKPEGEESIMDMALRKSGGGPGHHSQISFKNGSVIYTALTVAQIWEALKP